MKMRTSIRIVAYALCAVMLLGVMPLATFAAWADTNVVFSGEKFGTNGYYNVISKKDYTLVPGVAVESEMVINNASGTRRQVMHIIEVDPSSTDISIVPGYYGIDKDLTKTENHKAAGVTECVEYYEDTLGYNVVGAMNTGLAYDCNAPYSWLVYNGKVLVDHKNGINDFHSGVCSTMLCVYKNDDGSCYCELRTASQGLRGDEWQAVGANFGMVVNNGELVTKTEERTSSPAARSMVGVKEDGTLVLVMNDGRGANNSVGFCNYEEGEAMLALGCKWAFNCDGGGSSSFVTKRVGEDKATMRCVPCDGAERATLNSVLIVSNVAPTGELDVVNVESDYDYFAPNTAYTFTAEAIDTHGYSMDMPTDATWTLSDTSFGTIENGKFVSNGKLGDVTVQITSGGKTVGQKTIHVANPTALAFAQSSTVIPYGKSATLQYVSTIGEAEVYLDASCFEYTFSNASAGTLNGLVYTATTDESVSGTTITSTYKATGQKMTFEISFGKGSEVLYDFENGDISAWLGTDDTAAWLKENGVTNPFGTLTTGGQISSDCKTTTFLSTKANGGQVHNGKNALGINFDMTQVSFNSWVYGLVYNVKGNTVLRDVSSGKKATTLGMWMYMPEDFSQTGGNMAFQLTVYIGFDGSGFNSSLNGKSMSAMQAIATTGYGGTQIHFKYNGKNLNALSENDIPENRWIYVTADISDWDYVALVDPLKDDYRSPSFLRTYIKPDVCRSITWYIDDITLDYSSAVDDRVPPTISDPQYAPSDTNIDFTDGVTITATSAGFTATVSDDNSGIDVNTAAIYIDGNKVSTTKVVGNLMSCSAVALGVGTHKVKFEIADKLGNYTTLTRTVVSATDDAYMFYRTRIELAGHNDSGETPLPGSIYYIDVCNNYSEGIGSAEFTLSLNTANTWLLDKMLVTDGYNVSYKTYENDPGKVTFTCSSAKMNGSKVVMFSIPVRVYNPNSAVSGKSFKSDLVVELTSCSIGGSYGNYDKLTVISGSRTNTTHTHTAAAVDDKAPTCTESGYTGRTYCDACKSVVDWGTVVEAKGHSYTLDGDKFVCSECDHTYGSGTGIFEMNGKLYYSIAGKLVTGWQNTGDGYCFAYSGTYQLAVGETAISGITYDFGTSGVTAGAWIKDENGTKYSYGPDYYRCDAANPHANTIWAKIGENTYAFDKNGYRHEKLSVLVESNSPAKIYEFTAEGVLIGEYTGNHTGIFACNNATTYLENGVPVQAGLVYENGYYYYINSGYVAVTGSYNVSRTNGLMEVGTYTFDDDGRMINPPGSENGVIDNCLYINGVLQKAYQLVEFDGNYYFINNGKNEIARSITLYLGEQFVSGKTFADGTAVPAGSYEFDADGKMVIKHGIIGNCLYINGALQKAYQLVEFDGNYYFINNGKNEIARSTKLYLNEQFVSGKTFADGTAVPAGYYEFDADGKMLVLNGPNADGFFYINGVKQLSYQLIKYQGNYYFINDYNKYATDKMLYLNAEYLVGTGLNPWYYTFDTEGKMVGYIDGLYNGRDIGDVYYFKTTDGEDVKSGLLIRASELDGGVSYTQPTGIDYLKNNFNVKTEMDLRGNIANSSDVLGENVDHLYFDMVYYDEIFTDEGKSVMKQIFDVLCDKNNYPIYMHCTHGVDRTGTVGYVLGAVLGVSESNLCREYMLSHNAYGGSILKVQNGLHEKYEGSTQKARAEAYLLDCGITQEQIASLREIYLAD